MSAQTGPQAGEARLGRRAYGALAVLFLAHRALVHGALWLGEPLTRVPISDAAYYRNFALALANGAPFEEGLAHWLPPLYPWLLSVPASAGLSLPGSAIVLQALFGVATALLLVRLVERLAGRSAALGAGALWLVYGPVVLHESRLLGVNAALPLALLALLALDRGLEPNRPRGALFAAGAGVAAGLSALAHPNLLLALPAALAADLFRRFRARGQAVEPRWVKAALAAGLGFALGLAPGLWANVNRSGQWVLSSANGGVNFGLANRPEAGGTFVAPGPEWGGIENQRYVARAQATRALGREVDDRETSEYFFAEGRRYLLENPGAALGLWSKKLFACISSAELDVQVVLGASRREVPLLWIAPLPFGLLLGLSALGFARVPRGRALLWGWIAAGIAASLLYFHYPRFRLVWMLGLMPFAGAGLARLCAFRREWNLGLLAPVGLGIALVALSFAPLEGTLPTRQLAHGRVDQGLAWMELRRPDRARAAFEDALSIHPGEVRAMVELARFDRNAGRREAARERLTHAVSLGVDYPPALLELVYLELGSPNPAERQSGEARARAWLGSAPASSTFRPAFVAALVTSLLDRARQAPSGEPRDALLGEARAELEALGRPAEGVLDTRALLWAEWERLAAGAR